MHAFEENQFMHFQILFFFAFSVYNQDIGALLALDLRYSDTHDGSCSSMMILPPSSGKRDLDQG